MKQQSKSLSLFIVLLMCIPTGVFARFGEKSRYEVGYCYVMAAGKFKGNVPQYDFNSNFYLKDTLVERNVTATTGFGGYIGINFPIGKIGGKGKLAVSVGLLENGYIWGKLNPVYGLDGTINESYFSSSLDGVTVKLAVPISLDVKYGTDAFCSRNAPVGFTFGAGIMPQYNFTAFSGGSNTYDFEMGEQLGFAPFAKAEVSFFTGFCWKIKAIGTFGNVPLIDIKTPLGDGTDYIFQLKETTNFSFVLSVLPFSYNWKKIYWWNNYETRKPYY